MKKFLSKLMFWKMKFPKELTPLILTKDMEVKKKKPRKKKKLTKKRR